MNKNSKFLFCYVSNVFLINNFKYNNPYQIYNFDKFILDIKINTSLYEEESAIFPKAMWLLEHITGQKPFVKNLKTTRIGRNQRRIFFSTKVSIRNLKVFNFIYFYNSFIIKSIKKRSVFYNRKINSLDGNYMYSIKDINIFPGYVEDFFKWPFFINCNFVLKNYDIIYNKTVLQIFSIVVK